jgi:NADPH:quinone reductase-like Zn-dependent oxidoreductase
MGPSSRRATPDHEEEAMKAAVRDSYGTPDVVRIEDVETPVPTEDRVLVRVSAASVNRGDLDGLGPKPQFARLFMGLRAPRERGIGLDVAGVVETVGPTATRFKPGDRVFGDMFAFGTGSFAEYVCARERAFETIPDGMSFEDASTLPHAAVLALQGLRLRGGRTPGPGDNVLIGGASGNVGPFAVQVAKSLGAEVTGVASTDKLDFVRSLGVHHVLDYTQVDYTKTGERYNWIVDTDSHYSIFAVRRALKPNGAYITLGGSDVRIIQSITVGPLMSAAGSRWTGLLLWWKPFNPDDVEKMKELYAAGTIKPVIDRRYPLDEVVDALRYVDDGHARGKVVITM